ncbi:polysaccharide lyase family 1 protein [Tulasnella calospora MUT 4182]|uniref:pectin lyase n=1 Tax=Tulasnella calospora MUT 4182 TaxID=1051891 RepID=A0A0C3PW47_9AGAM|nr:polysaccharide lyase family 1 protein [Tulasnella calospora MUT 4182]
MKSISLASLVVAIGSAKFALGVAEYGQCGGSGWTGDTTCDSGLTCVYQNDWYYQCLKSSSTATTTTSKTTTTTTKITTTTTKTTTTATSSSTGTSAKGTPVGFGAGTTGGAGGVTVTPTTQAELITYLSDSTTRTIILTKIFDFTTYYGTTTGKACKPWTCTNGYTPQMTIDTGKGECDASLTLYSVTYYQAGHDYSLKVGSNKTLLGQGSSTGIKGIGLEISGVSNVIVQNIQITDINSQYVWGGDAILITGSSKVWVDHNYIARVGRQFIVTGFDPATQVTISNNYFDGTTSYSASCNGEHYWFLLFAGSADTITVTNNHIYKTSGRGPHVGGISGYNQQIHIVNNYYDTVGGHAIDAAVSSHILVEGNYFKSVTTPDTGTSSGGLEYFVQTVSDATTCANYLTRYCEWNRFESSGTVASRLDTSVLSALDQSAVNNLTPMGVADVPTYVVANAGVGIVN